MPVARNDISRLINLLKKQTELRSMDLPYTSLPRGLELQVRKYFEQKKMQHLFDNNLFEWIVKISNNDPLMSMRDNISKKNGKFGTVLLNRSWKVRGIHFNWMNWMIWAYQFPSTVSSQTPSHLHDSEWKPLLVQFIRCFQSLLFLPFHHHS